MFTSRRHRGFNIKCDCLQPGCSYCDSDGSITRHRRKTMEELMNQLNIKKQMETNDIKKYLYKQNPKAKLSYIRKGHAYYTTTIQADDISKNILFEIPVQDMGDADFHNEMDGKLLIRWILNNSEVEK